MGYYIECEGLHNKAQELMARFNAIEITSNEAEVFLSEPALTGDSAILCVVDNGHFEAAALCHNLDEFRRFTHPSDTRPKTWLLTDESGPAARAAAGYKVA
jgi:hypothetical protein